MKESFSSPELLAAVDCLAGATLGTLRLACDPTMFEVKDPLLGLAKSMGMALGAVCDEITIRNSGGAHA